MQQLIRALEREQFLGLAVALLIVCPSCVACEAAEAAQEAYRASAIRTCLRYHAIEKCKGAVR